MKQQSLATAKKAVTSERKKELQLFAHNAKIKFKNIELLNLAFVHRSLKNECGDQFYNNERLEFLGDSILGFVVSEYLYTKFSEQNEGYIAKVKSYVVSEEVLSKCAKSIGVEKVLILSKGEELSGGREKKALLADAMEALFGALYLDSGLDAAKKFILSFMKDEIEMVKEERHNRDYKTLLQEYLQKIKHQFPRYKVVKNEGPDHDKTFFVVVSVLGKTYGPQSGKSIKEAQQNVAKIAYHEIASEQ